MAIVNNIMERDKYKFDTLRVYVEEVFKKYLNTTEAGTKDERDKEHQRKDVLRQSIACCYAGTVQEKQVVKQFIYRILTNQVHVFLDEYGEGDIKITPDNYMQVFPWDNQYKLPTHVKFLGILYFWENQHGANTFDYLVSKYRLSRLREIKTIQGDERVDRGIYIDDADIEAIFEGEKVTFNYDLALKVLVQMIYEEFKGNGCIDELIYQNIDDIGIGLSGLQNDVEPIHLKGKRVNKAYEGVWVKHKGVLMNLKFLTFHNFANLKRVVMQLVEYDQQGSFSEKDGYKMGYGKDGSRRTSVIAPFAENSAAWVRKFTAKDLTNKQLIDKDGNLGIKNISSLIDVEKALVRGGATIPICGPQGAGKTTKLEALTEYIQNWYAIRMLESEFEARIRWRYPEKNILTVQTPVISPEEAYEFSLRTSGDIYIVSEVRSDEMMVNITRTANRGGRSVLFTYHPNKPRATVVEVANSLIRQKLYTSLKDAMYTTLEVIKCCIHIEVDLERRCRYYNIYEFTPAEVKLDNKFLGLSGQSRADAFMVTEYNYYQKITGDEYFNVVPIITYNRETNSYEYNNSISDRFYDELMKASSLNEEKEKLEKLFRPEDYLGKYIRNNSRVSGYSRLEVENIIDREGLNRAFIDVNKFIGISGVV